MAPSWFNSPTEDFDWLPFFLQTSDALFPTGAYAHSLGFEEIVRLGIVRDEATLRDFLLRQIVPAQATLELPFLRFVFVESGGRNSCDALTVHRERPAAHTPLEESGRRGRSAFQCQGSLAELCAIDREISAWKLSLETREASVQLGVRRLKALRTITDSRLLSDFSEAIEKGRARGHHLTVCGLQAAVENVPLAAALTAYFYQSLAAVCAAALKLIRIGQDGCQRSLREVCGASEATIAHSLTIARADAGCFNPLLEIASMRHARAHERLFIS